MRRYDSWSSDREKATVLDCGLKLLTEDRNEKHYSLRMWKPRATKPFMNYYYGTSEQRQAAIDQAIKNFEAHKQYMKERAQGPRDNRGKTIKQTLQKAFSGFKFRVRTDKYSMGESFHIKTDMLPKHPARSEASKHLSYYDLPTEERIKFDAVTQEREEATAKIKALVGQYERVSRCEITHDILSGGNTFMFIETL